MAEKSNGLVRLAFWLLGICFAVLFLIWLGLIVFGLIQAFPFGLFVLLGMAGIGILLFVVIRDRINNKEDDHYSKNVDE